MFLNSNGMAFYPLFTLNAFLYGAGYGLFLYRREKTLLNISVCIVTLILVINLFLTSLWLYFFNNMTIAFEAILYPRIVTALLLIPIQIICIRLAWQYVAAPLQKRL